MAYEDLSEDELAARGRALGQVFSRAWTDADYKARFLSDPVAVMAEAGLETPEGMEFRVVENTADTIYIVLPPQPSDELSDEELELVAGGGCVGTASSLGTAGTVGCPVLTFSTAGSVGTAGSA